MTCQYANVCLCMTGFNDLLVLTGLFVDKSMSTNCHAGMEAQQQTGLLKRIHLHFAIYLADKVGRYL